jgi:hypothetical protein
VGKIVGEMSGFLLNQFNDALDNTGLLNTQTTRALLFKSEVVSAKAKTQPRIHFTACFLLYGEGKKLKRAEG